MPKQQHFEAFALMVGVEMVPNPDGPGFLMRPYAKTVRFQVREHFTQAVFFSTTNPTRVKLIAAVGPIEIIGVQHGIHMLYPKLGDEYRLDTLMPVDEPNRPPSMFLCNFVVEPAFYVRLECRCVPELYPTEEVIQLADDARGPPTQHSSEAETRPPTRGRKPDEEA